VIRAHIDPFSGASGDMLLGAALDAGVALPALTAVLEGLDLPDWSLTAEPAMRGGIGATQAAVRTDEQGVVRTWANVRELLSRAPLPDPVRDRALSTCRRLAEAEARIHRTEPERVHFHEVGGVDAIVDVVGVCAGLHLLGVEKVTSAPVAQGIGMVRSAHGLLPVPAPAVLELLRGVPTYSTGIAAELCTPTGAALLAEWVDEWGPMPPMAVASVGYGAGSRDLQEQPNLLRLVLGTDADGTGDLGGGGAESAVVLQTSVDDLSGELVPPVLDALRAAGADDAWARQVLMKKGRPGVEIVCLAKPAHVDALRRVLFTETSTLGVRAQRVEKWALERSLTEVDVLGHAVRLKVGLLDGAVVNVAPEFADCAAVAEATGVPLKEVFALARTAWHRLGEGRGGQDDPPGAGPEGRPA
jgi:pyridinium-3,5-bisthiocarboxylic acid mononucleotide nickel chelatase